MPQESIDAVASAVAGAFAVEIGNKTSDNQDTDEMKL
jgi:hypothetical protein